MSRNEMWKAMTKLVAQISDTHGDRFVPIAIVMLQAEDAPGKGVEMDLYGETGIVWPGDWKQHERQFILERLARENAGTKQQYSRVEVPRRDS